MKFFNIFMSLLFVSNVYSQTLFEDSFDQSKPSNLSVQQKKVSNVSTKHQSISRYLATNLESIIARGDIQLLYEMPMDNGWSNMYYLHYNPQGYYNKITGDMGLLLGGRYYLDSKGNTNSLFLQLLGGFSHTTTWDLMISLDCGYRLPWKKRIFFDFSVAINRSYNTDLKDPMVYLKANVSFALQNRLLPFL